MLCLGIESTAHTFGCSIIDSDKAAKDIENNNNLIISEVRDIYKANAGWGIHPKEAAKHHSQIAPKILKKCLDNAHVSIKDINLIAYSA